MLRRCRGAGFHGTVWLIKLPGALVLLSKERQSLQSHALGVPLRRGLLQWPAPGSGAPAASQPAAARPPARAGRQVRCCCWKGRDGFRLAACRQWPCSQPTSDLSFLRVSPRRRSLQARALLTELDLPSAAAGLASLADALPMHLPHLHAAGTAQQALAGHQEQLGHLLTLADAAAQRIADLAEAAAAAADTVEKKDNGWLQPLVTGLETVLQFIEVRMWGHVWVEGQVGCVAVGVGVRVGDDGWLLVTGLEALLQFIRHVGLLVSFLLVWV